MENRKQIFKLLETYRREVPKPKRYAGKPNIANLKGQQVEGFELLVDWFNRAGEMFCLEGYAGTGKTTLISTWIEWVLNTKRTIQIAMTAPTNKAVRQLYKTAEYTHTNLIYGTIHSLLGLKEKKNDDGEQVFEKDWGVEAKIDTVKVLVIDETSMLADELFELIYPYVEKGLQIIFVGDPMQNPPIGKTDCIPFSPEMRREYGIEHFRMTKILRQAEGNPIIETSMHIRENIMKHNPLRGFEVDKITEDGRGVVFLNKERKDEDFLGDLLEQFYGSDIFKEDGDFVKIVGYTNKAVDYMNSVIREIIYKEEKPQKIKIGEKLIANKPIKWGDEILFTSNEEMEVVEFEEQVEDINEGQYLLKYYETKVKSLTVENEAEIKTIKIIHEDSEKELNTIIQQLHSLAKAQQKGSVTSKRYWENYWFFVEYFANVKYSYAITSHKAQGSTYNIAIVLNKNINQNSRVVERNKIRYTSTTRPKDLLIVVN